MDDCLAAWERKLTVLLGDSRDAIARSRHLLMRSMIESKTGSVGGLILKRASASRSSGEWKHEDYDVIADGKVVGRIMVNNRETNSLGHEKPL